MKEHSPSKEKEEEFKEKQDANIDIQVNTTIDDVIGTKEGNRDETHHAKLSFLHSPILNCSLLYKWIHSYTMKSWCLRKN